MKYLKLSCGISLWILQENLLFIVNKDRPSFLYALISTKNVPSGKLKYTFCVSSPLRTISESGIVTPLWTVRMTATGNTSVLINSTAIAFSVFEDGPLYVYKKNVFLLVFQRLSENIYVFYVLVVSFEWSYKNYILNIKGKYE